MGTPLLFSAAADARRAGDADHRLSDDPGTSRPHRLGGELTATIDGWTDALRADFVGHANNGIVGSVLFSETDRVRVWSIRLAPGERLGAHRHTLDYFFTALNDGESVQHNDNGSTRYVRYRAGDTATSTSLPVNTCSTTWRTSVPNHSLS